MLTIRPFNYTEADYAAALAIQNAVWPDEPETVDEWQYRDRTHNPTYFQQRFMVEIAGRPVAHARAMETHWSYRPGKYGIWITVHPEHQRQGIGGMIYEHILRVLAARPLPLTMLICNVREDKTHAIRFVEQRGFRQAMRVPISRLDVTRFEQNRFVQTLAKVAAAGVAIHSVAELTTLDPEHRRKIYELDWQCTLDEPLPDAPTKPPFEDYCKFFFETPTFIPEACMIAIDKGDYVGLSALYRNPAQVTELNTGFTAVLRTHRRRGIATALKVHAIRYAQAQGYHGIKTGNEENNPMFAINQMLGFTPQPAWLDFQKVIETSA